MQHDYLNETYNGEKTNMLPNAAYYCYTIYDAFSDCFYSGSRGVEGRNSHDLLDTYFTSSSVIDFVDRLRSLPKEQISFTVEYFHSRSAAFFAEQQFHNKFNVGKNPKFLNVINSGGSNCGSGTVLCRSDDGNTYRITVKEYASGNHKHVSLGMMNIRSDDGIKKIFKSDFDPDTHVTQFKNYVLARSVTTGKTTKVPVEVFNESDDLIGITGGIVSAIDTVTGKHVSVNKSEFDSSNGRYVGVTKGHVTVIDLVTDAPVYIKHEDFDPSIHRKINQDMIVVYSLAQRKNVRIPVNEYYAEPTLYANISTKFFFVVDDILFTSKDKLNEYYVKTRGKSVLRTKQSLISSKYDDIISITKKEHSSGKN